MVYIEIDFDYDDDFIELFLNACKHKYTIVNDGKVTKKDIIQWCKEAKETEKFQNQKRLGFLKIYEGLTLVGMSVPREIRHEEHEVWNLDPMKVYYRMGMIYVDENHRGKGYAKQAAKDFKDKFENILWTIDVDNEASKKVAASIGLTHNTTLYVSASGKWSHKPFGSAIRTLEIWNN